MINMKTIKISDETHFILNKIKADKKFKSFDRMFLDYFVIKEDVLENETTNNKS